MNIGFIIFALVVIITVAVSLMLMWHWKTYMPERGRGATIFTVYIAGLAILLVALFGTITQM